MLQLHLLGDLEPSNTAGTAGTMVFLFSNAMIVLGYVFAAIYVAPNLPVQKLTRYGAFAFFVTCGLTHMDQIIHTVWLPDVGLGAMSKEWHMFAIHFPQALSIWFFLIGFRRDMAALVRNLRMSEREAFEAKQAFLDARAAEAAALRLRINSHRE